MLTTVVSPVFFALIAPKGYCFVRTAFVGGNLAGMGMKGQ